jgi:acetyltransferase-like isoleucine patch superfamily enzyme
LFNLQVKRNIVLNFHYMIQRMLFKPTCVLEPDARLTSTARVRNALRDTQKIRIGRHSIICGELFLFGHGGDISIGEWCYIGEGSRIWSSRSIHIGDRVLVSHNVNIFDSLTHPLSAQQRHSQYIKIVQSGHPNDIDLGERPVKVNNDVWIGANACILRGVTIGEAAIVGAGSVVTHDIPPYSIVAGNPARVIRELAIDER